MSAGSGDFTADQASVRLSRTATWGGLETAASYGPEAASAEYAENLPPWPVW